MSSRLVLIVPAALAVLGCNTVDKRIGQDDPLLGEAVRYNAAAHIINPDPVYAEGDAQPGDNGAKGAAAVRRYRTDQAISRHNREARQSSAISTTGDSSSGGPQ